MDLTGNVAEDSLVPKGRNFETVDDIKTNSFHPRILSLNVDYHYSDLYIFFKNYCQYMLNNYVIFLASFMEF